MNKKTKIAAAALISFLAAGLIAGCGGDKKAASSAASSLCLRLLQQLLQQLTERNT